MFRQAIWWPPKLPGYPGVQWLDHLGRTVGAEVRELDVLSDKKSQAPPHRHRQGGRGGRGCTREWEGGGGGAVSLVSCTAQTATPSEWSMVTSSLLELRMPLQLNWTNWAVEGDRGASEGPAAGRAGWLHAAGDGGGSNNGLGAGGPGRRMTVGEGLKLFWGREGVEGLSGAAEMKANGEKVKLAGDMDGREGKIWPEGLNVKGERSKLCCVRVVGDGQKGAVGLAPRGESVKFARGIRGGGEGRRGTDGL